MDINSIIFEVFNKDPIFDERIKIPKVDKSFVPQFLKKMKNRKPKPFQLPARIRQLLKPDCKQTYSGQFICKGTGKTYE